jgi:hypothetical protein
MRAAQQQYGPLSGTAIPLLREYGRAVSELERIGEELELAHTRNRRRDIARLRKHAFMLREQVCRLERRLEELGAQQRQTHPLAAVHRMVEEANRR